jgi:cytochrome c peroxidase
VNGVREKAIFGQGQLQPRDRFVTVLVSEFEEGGSPRVADGPTVTPLRNPIYTWIVDPDENGQVTRVVSPDPGRMLVTGLAVDRNRFKVPTLWGSKDTAPFFHDNSAATLEQLMEHYRGFFILAQPPPDRNPPIVLTPEDAEDIVAFLKLL